MPGSRQANDPYVESMIRALSETKDSEYSKFFRQKMDDYGVESPAELSNDEKSEFFDAVDKEWKAKGEIGEAKKLNLQFHDIVDINAKRNRGAIHDSKITSSNYDKIVKILVGKESSSYTITSKDAAIKNQKVSYHGPKSSKHAAFFGNVLQVTREDDKNKVTKDFYDLGEQINEVYNSAMYDGSVYSGDNADDVAEKIQSGIKGADHVRVSVSKLGGKGKETIMGTVGLDPKSKWPKNIFENSRFIRFSFYQDGTIDVFEQNYPSMTGVTFGSAEWNNIKKAGNIRKTKAKNIADAIKKINDGIKKFDDATRKHTRYLAENGSAPMPFFTKLFRLIAKEFPDGTDSPMSVLKIAKRFDGDAEYHKSPVKGDYVTLPNRNARIFLRRNEDGSGSKYHVSVGKISPVVGESKINVSDHSHILKTLGSKSAAPIDRAKFPPIKGMEGPFRFKSGAILYYDPKECAYYDRRSDIYIDKSDSRLLG